MSAQDDDSDKSFDPTPQKLEQARKKGDIARSNDLQTAAAYAGFTISLLVVGVAALENAGTALMVLLDQPDRLARLIFDGAPNAPMGAVLWQITFATSPVFILPALAVALAILVQRGFVFAPSKLQPKLSRISLLSNAKNKFGRGGLFEFAKSFSKLLIYSACLALFLRARLPDIATIVHANPNTAVALLGELMVGFLFVVVLVATAIGAIDAVWQHHEHIRKNRMSRKEIMDESKEAEGDPHMKQERRGRAQAIASAQMMADVPDADVVIVNPTHFAVALKWSRTPGSAPTCVAKGVDEIARRIREIAAEAGIPIHSDPPTARALHAVTEIGDEIAPKHYHAVAAAIRFADAMRMKAKNGF